MAKILYKVMKMKTYFFESDRLGFRNWIESDIEPFVAMNQDQRVMEFFPALLTRAETLLMVERIKGGIDKNGFGFFAVDLLENDAFIGFIGINYPRFESYFTPCIEIGWRLDPHFWHRGLATEGAKACLNFAFNSLNISKIYAFTPLQNKPSEKVMQRIDMTKEGEFEHPMLIDSLLRTTHLYSIQNPKLIC
jgi:[ribosomal protein S5]-alanine N-acetyltransferase